MDRFNSYLDSLRRRTQQEADAYVQRELTAQRFQQNVSRAIQAIGDRKRLAGEYRFRAEEKGLYDPSTAEPSRLTFQEQRIKETREKIQARKDKLNEALNNSVYKLKDRNQVLRNTEQLGVENDKLNKLNQRLTDYEASPEFKRRTERLKWMGYMRDNPIGSPNFHRAFQPDEPEPGLSYLEKKRIDAEFKKQETQVKDTDKLESIKTKALDKVIKATEKALLSSAVRDYAKDALQKLSDRYKKLINEGASEKDTNKILAQFDADKNKILGIKVSLKPGEKLPFVGKKRQKEIREAKFKQALSGEDTSLLEEFEE